LSLRRGNYKFLSFFSDSDKISTPLLFGSTTDKILSVICTQGTRKSDKEWDIIIVCDEKKKKITKESVAKTLIFYNKNNR